MAEPPAPGRPEGPLAWELPLGARPDGHGATTFRVWAPRAREVSVVLAGAEEPLRHEGGGVFAGTAAAAAGDDYRFRLDGGDPLPDPCSRSQRDGVRGPSQVVDPAAWTWDEGGWTGLDRRGLVVYELHVGTFTPEGTFAAAGCRRCASSGFARSS
jgi:maltooligosyltrehalose trehalohydrolase